MKKAIVVKRNTIVEITASLLLIFFVHTFISSFVSLQSLQSMLMFYTSHSVIVSWIILSAEFVTITLLLIPATRMIGLFLVLLIISFAAITLYLTPGYPHDFGGVFNHITKVQKWTLMITTFTLSLVGILFCSKKAAVGQIER